MSKTSVETNPTVKFEKCVALPTNKTCPTHGATDAVILVGNSFRCNKDGTVFGGPPASARTSDLQ